MIMFDRISIERLFQSPPNTDNDHNVFSDSCIFLVYICYLLYVSIYLEDHTWHAMNSSKIILGIKTDPRYLIFFQGKLPHPSKHLGEKLYLKAIGVANSPVSCNSRLGVTSPRFHARDFKFCIIPSTWHTWHAMNSSGIILG